MSMESQVIERTVQGLEPNTNAKSLTANLREIDIAVQDLIKDTARAIATDQRCYISEKDVQLQSLASRALYSLVNAREAIAEFCKNSSEM